MSGTGGFPRSISVTRKGKKSSTPVHPWTRTLTLEACEVKVFCFFFLQKPEIVFVFEDFCVKTLNLTFALT